MGLTIGTLYVRRSILIDAKPARVWEEFQTADRLLAWLNIGHTVHELEPEIGGRVEMSVEIDGAPRFYGGTVQVLETARELSFTSQWHPPHHWPVPTFWTIRLTPMYEGTLVELFHHGFERLGAEAADNLAGYEEGWGLNHLTALRTIVEAGGP